MTVTAVDHLVLASASPRRRELLGLLGIGFDVVVPDIDELTSGDPSALVVENALLKARAGARLAPAAETILGVDTDVVLDGEMLGKPRDAAGAEERLRALAGRTHEVLGGVALIHGGAEHIELVRTAVSIRRLSDPEIRAYVASGEWEDRAGGYAVQGYGSSLIERIEGDLSNVIGLPIPALSRMIARLQNG